MPKSKGAVKGIKGKVILSLLLACVALITAWSVSNSVFNEMLNTVDNVSAPSKRLTLVTAISRKIAGLDQQQKTQAFKDPNNYRELFKQSSGLKKLLDSLMFLYSSDSLQMTRIATIKRLLVERDRQFINYLLVRERLVKSQTFSKKVKDLSSYLAIDSDQQDSTILATEHKTSTTTFSPNEDKSRSFFGRIFGKKKDEKANSFTIISEEKVKRDTIALAPQDLLAKKLEVSLRKIEIAQKQNSARFLNREVSLARANNKLISRMLEVLRVVEHEVIMQINVNGLQAKKVVNGGINTITVILLIFLLITVVLLYLILTDIANTNKYRQQLELAKDDALYHSAAKQRFLANMSHEIRTPLQSIIGYTEVVLNDPSPKKKHIEAVRSSSEHLLQIVNEILDYNRIVSGKFEFSNHTFNIQKLLGEVVSIVSPQAESKAIKLVTKFDLSGLSNLNGDPFRLKQILLNLLANAIKFTDSGEVRLTVNYKRKELDNHFTFIVEDTGIGITADQTKIIFNEFEQINQSGHGSHNQSGAGLGLTIIKSLVENQKGRIYVKSVIGKGSAFTVYLSYPSSDTFEARTVLPKEVVQNKSGLVWVVDDDHLILELCELFFSRSGIRFKSFDSPAGLLNSELTADVSHILMDIRMPGMTGEELCAKIRKNINHQVKILAITAQALPEEKEHLLRAGFDGVIAKPFKMKELIDAVSDKVSIDLPSSGMQVKFEQLEKMTFGDSELMNKIVLSFLEETSVDTQLVFEAMKNADQENLSLILHRMAGRIGQIGAIELAGKFRTLEIAINKSHNSIDVLDHHSIVSLIDEVSFVTSALKEYVRHSYSIS
ncbi:MAG: ATP-binding protein [Bacteroidota bacterium]